MREIFISINKKLDSELYITLFTITLLKKEKKFLQWKLHVNIRNSERYSSFDLSINEIKENAYSGHQRRTLVVDIDKTICESPKGKDYSKCEPIEPVCKKQKKKIIKVLILSSIHQEM